MDYLYNALFLFGGVGAGIGIASLMSINKPDIDPKTDDTLRLDFLTQQRASLIVSKGGEVYGVMTGTDVKLMGDMAPDPRTALDSARFKVAVPSA
jgi:hypothetical protein